MGPNRNGAESEGAVGAGTCPHADRNRHVDRCTSQIAQRATLPTLLARDGGENFVFLSRREPETTISLSGCIDTARAFCAQRCRSMNTFGGKLMVQHIRIGALFILGCWQLAAVGGELNQSMQSFFDGKLQQAHQSLTQQISTGSLDARVHYFRGLANSRLGDAKAAAADFQKAAELELSGGGYGVGEALQRVQGRERLMLEKYRKMARLTRRYRRQPIAPKPNVARISDRPVTAVPGFVASTPNVPRFRLASEVPIRSQLSDSYADQRASLVSNERAPSEPKLVPSSEDDEPVGTGVVQVSATEDVDPDDPFASDDAEDAEGDDPFADLGESESSATGSSLFGAFRAIGRAIMPKVDPQAMVPQLPIPAPPNGPPQQ